jgi:hypothetical protein
VNERNQPRRKRPRSRNRSGGANAPGGQAPKKDAPKVDLREFWGDPELLPERIDGIRHSPDVRAVLTSLGRPPLTGNETPAEHWFSLVYERAAFLAGALAAAGALDAADESVENP